MSVGCVRAGKEPAGSLLLNRADVCSIPSGADRADEAQCRQQQLQPLETAIVLKALQIISRCPCTLGMGCPWAEGLPLGMQLQEWPTARQLSTDEHAERAAAAAVILGTVLITLIQNTSCTPASRHWKEKIGDGSTGHRRRRWRRRWRLGEQQRAGDSSAWSMRLISAMFELQAPTGSSPGAQGFFRSGGCLGCRFSAADLHLVDDRTVWPRASARFRHLPHCRRRRLPQGEATHVLLGGDVRCPLIGLGTYKLASADGVAKALEREASAACVLRGTRARLGGNELACHATLQLCSSPCAAAVGYRMLDCAPVYENESVVGQGLKSFLEQVRLLAARVAGTKFDPTLKVRQAVL